VNRDVQPLGMARAAAEAAQREILLDELEQFLAAVLHAVNALERERFEMRLRALQAVRKERK
jgi:hypothetical protein